MSIFRSTWPAYVQRQINARQDLVKSHTRDSTFYQYTTGKNAWCRMTSFVDYSSPDGKLHGGDLAKQYILEGGTLYPNPNGSGTYSQRSGVGNSAGSYTNTTFTGKATNLGLRPMPGIVSVDIKSRGAYGSLREATVKFMAHTKAQLEDLEILFMRTGYGVLVEWGWSLYMDTYTQAAKGSSSTPAANHLPIAQVQVKNFTTPTINAFTSGLDPHTLYRQIESLRDKASGNYDGMYGLIKNFQWVLLENGSYECTTVLISVGDVLDSLKINSTSLPVSPPGTTTDQTVKNLQTRFEALFTPLLYFDKSFFINTVIGQALYQSYLLNPKQPYDPANIDFNIHSIDFSNGPSDMGFKGQQGSLHYISFAAFIVAMSAQFNLFDPRNKTAIPILDMEPPFPGYGTYGNGLCLASVDTISIDPRVCMIKNHYAQFTTGLPSGFDVPNAATFYPFHYQQNQSLGVIGNIYLCVENLISTFKQMVLQTGGYLGMHEYLKAILKQCSFALGSLNDFGIFVIDSSTVVIDTHYVDPEATKDTKFIINLTGTDTVIRNFNVTSKIFESQSTLVAVAAGVRENIGAVQSSTYNLLNRGLTDRISVQKLEYSAVTSLNAQTNPSDPEGDYRKKLASMVINLRTYVQSYITGNKDLSQIDGNREAANSNLNSVLLKINTDTNYKAVLPISVEFTMDGIGGIVIGNVFRINPDSLPREYVRKNLGLIVTSLSTKLERSDWATTVGTQCCILEPENVKGSPNTLDKTSIEKEVTNQNQVVQTQTATDLLKQVYIYNGIVKALTEIFGAASPQALSYLNQWNGYANIFPPNSPQAVSLYALDSYIYTGKSGIVVGLPGASSGVNLANTYGDVNAVVNAAVADYPDYDSLNADFQGRIKTVQANIVAAIGKTPPASTVSVPIYAMQGSTPGLWRNIFINTQPSQ